MFIMIVEIYVVIISLLRFANSDEEIKFICSDGAEISYTKLCDGISDCMHNSDESKTICQRSLCPLGKFRCNYGACIDRSKVCDGITNCLDNSDESQCRSKRGNCPFKNFRCNSGECIPLTWICDDLLDCSDGSDEDNCKNYICPNNTYHCKYGGCVHLNNLCDGIYDCIDGSDETDSMCTAIKSNFSALFCPPIITSNIIMQCTSPTKDILPCNNHLPVGTVLKYGCKPYYKLSKLIEDIDQQVDYKLTCQLDGTWNGNVHYCEAECGIQFSNQPIVNPLIVHGRHVPAGEWPWHAVIYLLDDGKWEFSCGGTLVSENAIITAGHCVWEIETKDIKIAVGQYYAKAEALHNYTQFRLVKYIISPPTYQDNNGNYGSDIAVLILENAVEFSDQVKPACIDWNSMNVQQINPGSFGKIAGLGLTESGKSSKRLLYTKIPVIDSTECIKNQIKDFKKYITYNTFCAGKLGVNGTGVCNGDSGGGLLFKNHEHKWYLQGIVSVSPRKLGTSTCDSEKYTVFTKVASYIEWLVQTIGVQTSE